MAESVDILHAADEHGRLLRAITELESAPAELRETSSLIEAVERDLSVREKRLQELVKKRKSEAKDVDKLQRSGTKRLLFKLRHGGKEGLDRKLEKEEREYVEAAQAEYNENQAIAELKETLQVSKAKKVDLIVDVNKRKRMLQQINDLYTSAFSGPTPDFPEEDAAEDELKAAELHNEEVQARLAHERHVFSILDRAAGCANQALASLQNANRNATYDTFGFGGIWAEMAEQDDLVRAQSLASQAERHMQRARDVQPLVNVVQGAELVKPDWLNVVFDNLYTDFVFQQKIRQSLSSMTRFQQGIFGQCKASEERIKQLELDAADAQEFLNSRRRQLMNVRREILARVREEGPSAGGLRIAPPAYDPERPPSPVGSMPGAFPEHPSTSRSLPSYAGDTQRPSSDVAPPSYSSDALRASGDNNVLQPTVQPPSRPPSPSARRYAPPAGPPPHHLHHESGVEVDSDPPESSHRHSSQSSRTGSPAPAILRSSSNSARASVYAPPPGPPPSHASAVGTVRMTHDGLVRTPSASSSYVTSLTRPGTPASPLGTNVYLQPHSPSRSPPRTRSPSPSPSRSLSSRPPSPLPRVSALPLGFDSKGLPPVPHSQSDSKDLPPFPQLRSDERDLPVIPKSLPPAPSMPVPSMPSLGTSTSVNQSSSGLAGSPFSPLSATGSGLGHSLLWGAPVTDHDEVGHSAFTSPPSMPVPTPFSHSAPERSSANQDNPSGSLPGDVNSLTPDGNESQHPSRLTEEENNARSRFASNNPFRNFVS